MESHKIPEQKLLRRAKQKKERVIRLERAGDRTTLQTAIFDLLMSFEDWNFCSCDRERVAYISGLTPSGAQELYTGVRRIVLPLEEIKRLSKRSERDLAGGWVKNGAVGFVSVLPEAGKRLGMLVCNRLGLAMCEDFEFSLEKGQKILAALEKAFPELKKSS